MSNVTSLADHRIKSGKAKARTGITLPFPPFKGAGFKSDREVVIAEITSLIQQSGKLCSQSYMATLPYVTQREKAVVDSMRVMDKARELAASINCKIVRAEKENEIIYTIKDKG